MRSVREQRNWRRATLLGIWTHATDLFPASFRREPNGVVRFRGQAKNTGGVLATPSTIFYLPIGFRPPADLRFITAHEDSDGSREGVWVKIQSSDGAVIVEAGITGNAFSGAANSIQHLNQIAFASTGA